MADELSITLKDIRDDLKNRKALEERLKLSDQLEKLRTEGSENADELSKRFETAIRTLDDKDAKATQKATAQKQLNAIQELAGDEESQREAEKAREEQNDRFRRMEDSLKGMATSFDNFASGAKKGLGIMGALGALGLLMFDPDTLIQGLIDGTNYIFDLIQKVQNAISGDGGWGDVFSFMTDNLLGTGVLLTTLGLFLGGPLIRAVSGVVSIVGKTVGILGKVLKAAKVFRIFMLKSFIPGMMGMFSTISASVTPILVAAAPFVAIGAAVAGIVTALYQSFQTASDTFEETGSITETIITFLTDLVTAPLRWAKSLTSWVLEKLGFEELATKLDQFDITKTVTDAIMAPIRWVQQLFTDPTAALDTLKMNLIGPDGLITVISDPIDKAVNWVMGLFGWSDPENPFSLTDVVFEPIDKSIEWVKKLFTDPTAALSELWNGIVGQGGLIDFLFTPIDKAIAWIQGVFNWGDPEDPFSFSQLVKDGFNQAKAWVTGLFTWGSEAAAELDEQFSISQLVRNAIDNIWQWFQKLLDIDVTSIVKSIPGGETLLGLFEKSDQQAALNEAEESGLYDKDLVGNSEINRDMVSDATDNQLSAILADDDLREEDKQFLLDEMNKRRDRVTTQATGEPISESYMINGKPVSKEEYEAARNATQNAMSNRPDLSADATPVRDSVISRPELQASVYDSTNQMNSEKAAVESARGSGDAIAANVNVGGATNNNASVNNSNYTISNGFTADDMVRMQFLNGANLS